MNRRRIRVVSLVVAGAVGVGVSAGSAYAELSSPANEDPSAIPSEIPSESVVAIDGDASSQEDDDVPKDITFGSDAIVPLAKSSTPSGVLPDGRTYGPVPRPADDSATLSAAQFEAVVPDLVAVIGDGGKQGFADSEVIFGDDGKRRPGEPAPKRPDAIPVFDVKGKRIDVLTVN